MPPVGIHRRACSQWLDKLFVALHADLMQLAQLKLDVATAELLSTPAASADEGMRSEEWLHGGLLALRLGQYGFAKVCFEGVAPPANQDMLPGSYYFAKLLLVKQYIDGNELVPAMDLMHLLHATSTKGVDALQSAVLMNRTRHLVALAISVHGKLSVKEAGKQLPPDSVVHKVVKDMAAWGVQGYNK
jgi:hypothetical protein